MDALQHFLGVENNQVLIREYEIIGTNFENFRVGRYDERGFIDIRFRKHTIPPDDTNEFRFIAIFTLKEYFIHLLEEPVDQIIWLRIKQPGTYAIHLDHITDSFAFTHKRRDNTFHFSEHNPKHAINLEKGENCLLTYRVVPRMFTPGSKIYVYDNI